MSMVWSVYMGASLCVRERFHIRILAGVMVLPRRVSFWFRASGRSALHACSAFL